MNIMGNKKIPHKISFYIVRKAYETIANKKLNKFYGKYKSTFTDKIKVKSEQIACCFFCEI